MVYDCINDVIFSEDFDYVVVVMGYFLIFNVLFFKGLEIFKGCFLYFYDVCDVVEFKDYWMCLLWEGVFLLRMLFCNVISLV